MPDCRWSRLANLIEGHAAVSPALASAVATMLEACLACLAIIASKAFHVTSRSATPRLRPLLETVREIFPPLEESCAPGPDAEAVGRMITAKVVAHDRVSGETAGWTAP